MQNTNEFSSMLKGLSDKNSEKEKETKLQCERWIGEKIHAKDEKALEGFFDFLIGSVNGVLSNSALNALGIFAHSVKNYEKMKEFYVPKILEILIESYFQNEANPKVKDSLLYNKKIISSNLLSIIVVAQNLIFPFLHKIMEILFRMKKDQTDETVAFSKTIDDSLYPIIKNDMYSVASYKLPGEV